MTKKPTKPSIPYQGLSEETIARLSVLEPNRNYLIAWDNEGNITELKTMSPASKKVAKRITLVDEWQHLMDMCIQYTNAGSMLIALDYDERNMEVGVSHPLGEGYVVYEKKPLRIFNTLEDALLDLGKEWMPELIDGEKLCLRYKRRQSKWFLHKGEYSDEVPSDFVLGSKEEPRKVYDLEKRSHLWASTEPSED